MPPKGKERIDRLCVTRGICDSRHKAQALILAGQILVDDQPVTKAGTAVSVDAEIRLRGEPLRYVSRGGLKLEAMLDHCGLDVDKLVALDVGASTGGFCDCLLQRGARHVIAVDVGYGQLAWKLRQDERVSSVERTNARHLDADKLQQQLPPSTPWPPAVATIDVSFISLTLVLPAVFAVLGPSRPIVALIKPQFEAGRGDVGKGSGVVTGDARQRAIDKVLDWAAQSRYTVSSRLDSPVPGPKGNLEHLVLLSTPETKEPASESGE